MCCLNVMGSVSSALRICSGIAPNNTLLFSISGIKFNGKFTSLDSQSANGFFPSMEAIKRSSSPLQIPSIGK